MKLIPLGISGRHAHLSQKTLDILFGIPNYKLTFLKNLKQKGQYASEEKIDIMSSSGQILKNVRILGPVRNFDQIEISQSDNLRCKFEAPMRSSGDIKDSSSATLIGPKGKVEIKEGVIIANRHIHFSLEEANEFNVVDKQVVNIEIEGIKSGVLGNVLCRVDKNFSLECHLDTDDASAFLLKTGDKAKLINPKII